MNGIKDRKKSILQPDLLFLQDIIKDESMATGNFIKSLSDKKNFGVDLVKNIENQIMDLPTNLLPDLSTEPQDITRYFSQNYFNTQDGKKASAQIDTSPAGSVSSVSTKQNEISELNVNPIVADLKSWPSSEQLALQSGAADILAFSDAAQEKAGDIPGTALWSLSQGLNINGMAALGTGNSNPVSVDVGGVNVHINTTNDSPQDIAGEVQNSLSDSWRELALSVSQGVNQ